MSNESDKTRWKRRRPSIVRASSLALFCVGAYFVLNDTDRSGLHWPLNVLVTAIMVAMPVWFWFGFLGH